MNKLILLFLTLHLSLGAIAQTAERQVLGSSGGSYSDPNLQVDYTVGETVTASGVSGSFVVNQGFEQNPTNTTNIKDKEVLVNFSLYPNPPQDLVTLILNTTETLTVKISLTNLAGQVLFADQQATTVQQNYKREIPLQTLASGVYFVNLYNEKSGLLQSIRFVKQ
jgi:hypothetical protein